MTARWVALLLGAALCACHASESGRDASVDGTGTDADWDSIYSDPWVPDHWDVPFDYMDIPADYVPDSRHCGNGVVDEGEECDDGNDDDHDACTNICLFPRCGDGRLWWGMEDCDPPGTVRPCTTECGTTGSEWCEFYCRWPGECVPPVETCGNDVDDDCDTVVDSIVRHVQNRVISFQPVDRNNSYIAWTGSEFGVLWVRQSGTAVFTRLDGWGSRIGDSVDLATNVEHLSSLHWTGSLFGYFYIDDVEKYYQAFDPSGVPVAAPLHVSRTTNPYEWFPAACSDSRCAVVDIEGGGTGDIHRAHMYTLLHDGSSLTDLGIIRTLDDGSGWFGRPRLAWAGSRYAFTYTFSLSGAPFGTQHKIFVVSPDGTATDSIDMGRPSYPESDEQYFDMIWTGSTLATAWVYEEVHFDPRNIALTINSTDGTLLDSNVLSTSATEHSCQPEIVWAGSEIGVFWNDIRDGNHEIYFSRTGPDATSLIDDARLTYTPEDDPTYNAPSVAWTGSSYGMTWRDWNGLDIDIYFTHFSPCP